MTELGEIAPAFVDLAHSIVGCTVSTTDPAGRPRSRVRMACADPTKREFGE
ncbi:hypothetical protein [Nocardia sp. NPDC057030]|uniref:hypothetical protein n=1 Tax=unclassified Nocardia TaxID=2637762 RepID=UPI00362EB91D